MPRLPRTVIAAVPHHITQRGNRRENVFFADEDYQTYNDFKSFQFTIKLGVKHWLSAPRLL